MCCAVLCDINATTNDTTVCTVVHKVNVFDVSHRSISVFKNNGISFVKRILSVAYLISIVNANQ